MNELERLANVWQIAKNEEEAAKARRIEVEVQMLKLHPAREEGSDTVATPLGIKIKLTGKITYKANVEALAALTQGWPEAIRPLKTKVEADESILKALRNERPDLWRQIAPAVETKAAKTAVSITFPGAN